MKTLREYIDQLDEISRRDALKYAGATAAGAALSKVSPAQAASLAKYAADLAIKTVFRFPHQDTGYDLRGHVYNSVYRVVSIVCSVGRCDRSLIDKVNRLAAQEAGLDQLNLITGMLTNMKHRVDEFLLAYATTLADEIESSNRGSNSSQREYTPSQKPQQTSQSSSYDNVERDNRGSDKYALIQRPQQSTTPTQKPQQSTTPTQKDQPVKPIEADSGPIKPGFEGKMLDTGMILYILSSRSGHQSKSAIKAALKRYADKTGLAGQMNSRIKELSATRHVKELGERGKNQYFAQTNQIIRDIDALTNEIIEPLEETAEEDLLARVGHSPHEK